METVQLLIILLSWAVTLNSYSAPEQLPPVEYKSEAYFHEHACSGSYDNSSCEDHAKREREAYAIQREYGIRASGSVLYIRMVIPPCLQV